MTITIFKYSELKKLLRDMKGHYKVTPLGDWDGSNAIILRHDVDFDIKAAYELSKVEKECGVRSTFFIMTSCNTYNPMSTDNRRMLNEMSNQCFEIGLHFDPVIYGNLRLEEMKKKVDIEVAILSSIINKKIKSVSLHNPSIHGQYPIFKGYYNAYDKRIFSSEKYISDSRMVFLHDIHGFLKRSNSSSIQILLHPLHYSEDGKSYPEIFHKFIYKFVGEIDTKFRGNSTYRDIMNTDLFSYILNKGVP